MVKRNVDRRMTQSQDLRRRCTYPIACAHLHVFEPNFIYRNRKLSNWKSKTKLRWPMTRRMASFFCAVYSYLQNTSDTNFAFSHLFINFDHCLHSHIRPFINCFIYSKFRTKCIHSLIFGSMFVLKKNVHVLSQPKKKTEKILPKKEIT